MTASNLLPVLCSSNRFRLPITPLVGRGRSMGSSPASKRGLSGDLLAMETTEILPRLMCLRMLLEVTLGTKTPSSTAFDVTPVGSIVFVHMLSSRSEVISTGSSPLFGVWGKRRH